MKITRQDRGKNILLILDGRLDAASASALKDQLSAAEPGNILVDLTDVEFMDSSGLGALVTGVRGRREHGGDLKISGLGDRVRRVFEMTRADQLFDIYDDMETALTSF